jgi:DNA-directed RNA polymerase specialized sigma24 family protein
MEVNPDRPEPSLGAGNPGKGWASRDAEALSRLLQRLDPDRARAWQELERIRQRLTRYFEWNHVSSAEDLADEVLHRMAAKPDGVEIREAGKYAGGIARKICLEEQRKRTKMLSLEDLAGGANEISSGGDPETDMADRIDREKRLTCLLRCISGLTPRDRKLALQYYSAEEGKQVARRKQLAAGAKLTLNALRVTMTRLRAELERCVIRCLETRRQSLVTLRRGGG